MDIKRIPAPQFDAMQNDWNALLSRSESDNIFLRWEWMNRWWNIFGQDRELWIVAAEEDGKLVGLAPLYKEKIGSSGLRVLRFCSEELSPDYLDFIAERGREMDVAQGIAHYLAAVAKEWDVMELDNLNSDSILLRDPSPFKAFSQKSSFSQVCPYVRLDGTFGDYYQSRKSLRDFSIHKKLKKLLDQDGVTHVVVSDEAGLSKGLDDMYRLHEMRAEDKNIESEFMHTSTKRFHAEISRLFMAQGLLNLQLLYTGESPISAFYAFNYKNKVYVFQTGMDPVWKKRSAGAVLTYLGVEAAFKEGRKEYDFLKGNETYKSLWANAMRDEMGLQIYNKTLRGTALLIARTAKDIGRRIKHTFKKPVVSPNAVRSGVPENSTPAASDPRSSA